MTSILIVIADPTRHPLTRAPIAELGAEFNATPRWLAEGEAAELTIDGDDHAQIRTLAARIIGADHRETSVDLAVLPAAGRQKRFLISDMDSTMITVECIDELADFAGVKSEVASITRRAMAGDLDYAQSLRARVRLLEGLSVDLFDEVYRERVRQMPGARVLVQTMRRWGAVTALVSGGFVPFAERVARDIGFEHVTANRLEVEDRRLTGRVLAPIAGPNAKLATLQRLIRLHHLTLSEALAVGDGANDLPMITAAGLGVAFRAHDPVAEASKVSIKAGDLTALLYLQGVPKSKFFVEKLT